MVWLCIVTVRWRVDAFNTPMAVSGVHDRGGGVMPACSTCSVADIELLANALIYFDGLQLNADAWHKSGAGPASAATYHHSGGSELQLGRVPTCSA